MQGLWKLDQDVFRAIQGLRVSWLDPLLQGITCTGLGWVQVVLIALLFVDWRRKRKVNLPVAVAFVCALAVAVTAQFIESIRALGTWLGIVLLAIAAVLLLLEVIAARLLVGKRFALALPLLTAYAATGIVNTVIKQSIPRDRPSLMPWVNAMEEVRYHSFSSGHTATAFGIAACLFWVTRDTPFASWGRWGWVWAALVGFSRMYVGVHWPSDVLCGAAVGVLGGTWVAWLFLRAHPGKQPSAPLPAN